MRRQVPASSAPVGRSFRAFTALAILLVPLSACSELEPTTVYELAEYATVAESLIATDVIIPAGEDAEGLGQGWDLAAPTEELASGVWVVGHVASFAFLTLGERPVLIEWEARGIPPNGSDEQSMSLWIAGVDLGTVSLPGRWTEGSVEIPAGLISRGVNRIELRFAANRLPDPDEADQRRLAARFRYLRATSDPGLAPWIDRPQSWRLSDGDDGPDLVMPVNSAMRLVVEIPDGSRLVGRATVDAVGPDDAIRFRAGSIERAVVHPLLEATVRAGGAPVPIDVELPPGLQRLEIEVTGAVRGTVTLSALRIEATGPAPAAALGPTHRAPPIPLEKRPHVVILVLDAARADAFSPWGGRATPAVDELAANGTVFDDATSSAPWTGPSVGSLLTGRYPAATGVQLWDGRLPGTIPTLFELASKAGYRTLLWSQHTVHRGNRSFRRGVDEYVDAPRSGDGMTPGPDELFVTDRPTFALVHLLPPHDPYDPPEPFRGRYSDWWTGEPPPMGAAHLNSIVGTGAPPVDPEYVRYVRDRYDENVAWADALVGRLVDAIRAAGRLEDTLFVLLSDHGEAFYEHGRFLHTQQVYRESLHIPMIFRWPAGSGDWQRRVASPVSIVDVLPTLAEAAGLDAPWDRLQGLSLLEVARGGDLPARALLASTLRVERHFQTPLPLARLRVGQEALIHDEVTGRIELYDLATDPGQQHDLVADRPLYAGFLAQQLRLLQLRSERLRLAESPAGAPLDLAPDVIEELRALGYIQ